MSGPESRKSLAELVRRPDPPAAYRTAGPDDSRARLDAANEMLAKTRRDFALWMEECARQRPEWCREMELRQRQWNSDRKVNRT